MERIACHVCRAAITNGPSDAAMEDLHPPKPLSSATAAGTAVTSSVAPERAACAPASAGTTNAHKGGHDNNWFLLTTTTLCIG